MLLGWAAAGDWGVEVTVGVFGALLGVAGVNGKLLPKLDSTISSSNLLRLMDRELAKIKLLAITEVFLGKRDFYLLLCEVSTLFTGIFILRATYDGK